LTDTTAFTNLVSVFEQTNGVLQLANIDTAVAGAFALPTWGTGQWGLAVYT